MAPRSLRDGSDLLARYSTAKYLNMTKKLRSSTSCKLLEQQRYQNGITRLDFALASSTIKLCGSYVGAWIKTRFGQRTKTFSHWQYVEARSISCHIYPLSPSPIISIYLHHTIYRRHIHRHGYVLLVNTFNMPSDRTRWMSSFKQHEERSHKQRLRREIAYYPNIG